MHWESLWPRIEEMVLRLIEARGETRNSLSQKMGRGRNYLGRYLRTDKDREAGNSGEPAFSVAFEVAEFFGLRPTSLLAPFETDSLDRILGMLPCDEPMGTEAAEAIRRCGDLGDLVSPAPKQTRLLDERIARLPALGDSYSRLEEMERRRHFDAEEAARKCLEQIAVLAEPGLSLSLPESVEAVGTLGIWGSIQRCQGQLKAAQTALELTVRWSQRVGETSLWASQLQRASYVFRDLGAPRIAVDALHVSAELFAADDNRIGEDRTLVDRAVMHANQGDLQKAEQLYRAALERLPSEGNETYRASASIGLAAASQIQSDLERALRFLDQALSEADPRDSGLRAHVLWVAGGIEHQLHLYEDAEAKYWQAAELFQQRNRADWVLMASLLSKTRI